MHCVMSAWGTAFVFAVTRGIALQAQATSPMTSGQFVSGGGGSHAALHADTSGSHRVRTAGIVGAAIGLTAGVVGASMLGFSDARSAARGTTYVGASGAIVGWIVGTTVALPFHGRSVIGPNDVRNATITGGAVGLMTGVAAGSLMGFKCVNGCTAARSPGFTIATTGLIGAGIGAIVGHAVGMLLPH